MKSQFKLPEIRGEYRYDEPLAPLTTLRMGGNAEVMFIPADLEDLQSFLSGLSKIYDKNCGGVASELNHNLSSRTKCNGDAGSPENQCVSGEYNNSNIKKPALLVLGEGSNALISDDGIVGVVIRLNKLASVELEKKQQTNNQNQASLCIYAEAGATNGKVARLARENSLTGAEFLCGIPGSIGGALKMNAGAYKCETFAIVEEVYMLDELGEKHTQTPQELGYGYRHSNLPSGWIYIGAKFKLKSGDKAQIRDKMRQINKDRTTSQPIGQHSSGSWFKNPIDKDGKLLSAWKVVADAGCRGLQIGNVQVSEKHANFFINLGGGKTSDMLKLTEMVKQKVKAHSGIELQQEVRVLK